MSRLNDTPFDESASPEVKALEFNLQVVENGGEPYPEPAPELGSNVGLQHEERRG